MRGWSFLLSLVATSALLFYDGPQQAFACTCAPFPADAATAMQRMEYPQNHALVVGVVERRLGNAAYPEADMQLERTYEGEMPDRFTVRSDNCNGIIADFKKGERWLMEIYDRDGRWETHGCGAGALDGYFGRPAYADADVWATALEALSPVEPAPAPPVADDDGGGMPWTVVGLIGAGAAALTLAGVYVAQRRRSTPDAD